MVTAGVGVALYLLFGASTAAPAFLALVFLLFFFRDPHRDSPSLPLAIVAPVDGHVRGYGARKDPWLGRDAQWIEMRMGLFNVHSLFSPVEGKIIEQWRTPAHESSDAQAATGSIAYLVRTDEGDELVLEISRGRINGPLQFSAQPGERVGHGRRIGYAALGCTVALYVDASSRIEISDLDSTTAASTVVATLMHDSPVSALEA